MWKDDARLSVHMYGDAGDFIFLNIQQESGQNVGSDLAKNFSIDINDATPESIGATSNPFISFNTLNNLLVTS